MKSNENQCHFLATSSFIYGNIGLASLPRSPICKKLVITNW